MRLLNYCVGEHNAGCKENNYYNKRQVDGFYTYIMFFAVFQSVSTFFKPIFIKDIILPTKRKINGNRLKIL